MKGEENMEQNIALSNRLKNLMEEKHLTFKELAEKSGIPVRRIYRMMHGGVSNPSVFVMMRICNAMDITLDEFFGTEELQAFAN